MIIIIIVIIIIIIHKIIINKLAIWPITKQAIVNKIIKTIFLKKMKKIKQ
jgi:hypothetical protein